jgi:hypothetical protein
VTCPHCGQAAEFHGHRPHTPTSLLGPVHYYRAYYYCRTCGKGLFPFDQQAGFTPKNLTPGLERVATLAGTVADSFERAADLMHEMAGIRLGESTVERTTEDAGQRLADALQAGRTFGPKVVWPWQQGLQGPDLCLCRGGCHRCVPAGSRGHGRRGTDGLCGHGV